MGGALLTGLVIVSTVAGIAYRPAPRPGAPRSLHPGWALLGVTAAIYLNQVLVAVYVARVHGGDVTFVTRYLPPGWFAVPDLGSFAALVPAPQLLAVCVLNVPALLELPFVLLAYLTVCRWCGGAVYARAVRLIWPAAVAWTTVFCLVEIELANPWTVTDVVLRLLTMAVTATLLARLHPLEALPVQSTLGLAVLAVSLGAAGGLVLVVYDTALLYNLANLPAQLPIAAAAAAVLGAARLAARRVPTRSGPTTAALGAALGGFLVTFFVPALPIRYGLTFGAPVVAALAGLAVTAAAIWTAGPRRLAIVVVAALVAAVGGWELARGLPELRLLAAAGAALAVALVVAALADRSAQPTVDERP